MVAEKRNDAVFITCDIDRSIKWEKRFLLISDAHVDNKGCRVNLLKKHLNQALEYNAGIIDNGDYFDCMGGKYDKRSNKQDILPELNTSKYFDSVVDYGAAILEPYKKNLLILSEGNHEISIRDRHEIDLTERLIKTLGTQTIHQKYASWIQFVFKNKVFSVTATMYRTHGTGGNAPVTKGSIQTARRQDIIDADIYISGHIHTEFTIPRPKWYLDKVGNVKIKTPIHQQIGTYKDSTGKNAGSPR